MLVESIRMALYSIWSNKMRAFLTMLGIIIGIGAVIAILTVGNSLTQTLQQNMQSMGSNDIMVTVSEKKDSSKESEIDGIRYPAKEKSKNTKLQDEDYITTDMIKDMCYTFNNQIYAVQISDQTGSGDASFEKYNVDISATGVSAGFFLTNKVDIVAGKMFSSSDFDNKKYVCLVDETLVDKLFKGDADKAIGKEIEVSIDGTNSVNCTIVGVYKASQMAGTNSQMMDMFSSIISGGKAKIYLPLKTSKIISGSNDKYEFFRISTAINVDPEQFSKELRGFFNKYYAGNSRCEVTAVTFGGMLDTLTSLMDKLTLAISIIAAIALLVGGIGVMNIMLVSVTERTREIGTRKALGAKNSDIRIQFLIEAIIICLIGGIIGLILGLTAGAGLSSLLGCPASPSVGGVIFSLLFSMGIGLAFGFFPANKAAKMNPIEALRYE